MRKHLRRPFPVVALTAALGIGSAGCAEDSPEQIRAAELPIKLSKALRGLEAAGYDVRPVATGPQNAPTLVVEGDEAIVVMIRGRSDSLTALNDVSDEGTSRATEFFCGKIRVAAASRDADLHAVVKASDACR